MPKPQEEKISVLTIQQPMGGWIPAPYAVPSAGLEGKDGTYTTSAGVSLVRKEKMGHIAPAEIFSTGSITDTGSYFNSLPRAMAIDVTATPNVHWYITGGLAGTAPGVVKVTSGATVSRRDITAPAGNFTALPGTGYWGEDIIFYTANQSSAAVPMILYAYNTSSTGGVGLYNIGSASFTSDDFFSSTYFAGATRPMAGVPHRFCEGPDKIVYMTNGQYIASYDGNTGANGTYNDAALNLGAGWVGVDVVKYQNYIAIACIKNGTSFNSYTSRSESKIVLWDGFSLDFNFSYDCEDNVVGALYNSSVLYAITQGLNGTTKLKYLPIAYGVSKLTTAYETSTASIGGAPDPRSLDLYMGSLTWFGNNTNTPTTSGAVSQFNGGFHQPFIVSDGTNVASPIGMVKNVSANQLYVGGKFGSTYKVVYLDGTGGAYVNGTWRSKLYELPYKSTIHKIIVYFSQFGSASSMKFSLYKDYTTTNDQVNETITQSTYGGWTLSSNNTNLAIPLLKKTIPDVSSFYINLTFNHSATTDTPAIVRKIEIYYSQTIKP